MKRWKATKDGNAQNHAQVGFARSFLLLFCSNDKKVERPIIKRITKNDKE